MHINKRNLRWAARWISLMLAGIFVQGILFAQQGAVQADNLKRMLCKTWEINYVLADAVKIERTPDAPNLVYQFNADNSFIFNPEDPKTRIRGRWDFDPEKKLIRLQLNGNKKVSIISLLPGELIMLVSTKNATADDPENMKMVFRVRD